MQDINATVCSIQGRHLLACVLVMACGLYCAAVAAYSPAQQVYDAPGGKISGKVRPGDTVQIKQLETVYRNGHSERWVFITYGDRYTQATGWVNLDKFKKQPPKAAAPSNTPYPGMGDSNTSPATIWDMNINCSKNQRRAIQSCELQMVVDIEQTYNSYNDILECSAELHWTDLHGLTHVSSQQANQPVNADGAGKRHRLELYYSFDGSGAKSATVENQECQTGDFPQQQYNPY